VASQKKPKDLLLELTLAVDTGDHKQVFQIRKKILSRLLRDLKVEKPEEIAGTTLNKRQSLELNSIFYLCSDLSANH
jgi:hypothetical protein